MSDQGGYGYGGNQNWQSQPPYGQPPYGPRPTNTLAVLALVFALLLAPLGIVFGHIARSQIKRTGEEGDGLALAGLIIGYIFTALGILAVVAWIAFFGMLAAAFGNAADEASSFTYTTHSYPATTTAAPRTTAIAPTAPRATTVVGPAPTVSGTDRQGFAGNGPSCNADNPAVAIAITTGSRIVICETGVGRYYYKGERLSDGAAIELDDPSRTAGGFTVTNNGVTYRLTSSGLVITENGSELGREPALEFWMN